MTEVSFHFNVSDRTEYTCRLVRKAMRAGAKVVVTGPVQALALLDRALWTFEATEFLPHVLLRRGAALAPRLRDTPVWLTDALDEAAHHDVLVNVGLDAPAGFESFSRLIEIVPREDDDRAAARLRWKHYQSRGYAIERHEVGG